MLRLDSNHSKIVSTIKKFKGTINRVQLVFEGKSTIYCSKFKIIFCGCGL